MIQAVNTTDFLQWVSFSPLLTLLLRWLVFFASPLSFWSFAIVFFFCFFGQENQILLGVFDIEIKPNFLKNLEFFCFKLKKKSDPALNQMESPCTCHKGRKRMRRRIKWCGINTALTTRVSCMLLLKAIQRRCMSQQVFFFFLTNKKCPWD